MINIRSTQEVGCNLVGLRSASTSYLEDGRIFRWMFNIEFHNTDLERTITIDSPSVFEDEDVVVNILLGHRAERVAWRDRTYNPVYHAKIEGDVFAYASADSVRDEGVVQYDPSQYRVYPGPDDGTMVYYPAGASGELTWRTNKGKWAGLIWMSGYVTLFGFRYGVLLVTSFEPNVYTGFTANRVLLSDGSRVGSISIKKAPRRWRRLSDGYTQYGVPDRLNKVNIESNFWGKRYYGNTYDDLRQHMDQAKVLLGLELNADGSDTYEIIQWSNQTVQCTAVSAPDVTALEQYFRSMSVEPYLAALSSPRADWHDLATRAYQNIGLWGSNGLAYMKDLPGTPALCYDLSKRINAACSGLPSGKAKVVAKSVAATYLGLHYGLKLTILDTAELKKKLAKASRFRLSRVSAQSHVTTERGVHCDFRYTCVYDQFAMLEDELSAFSMITDTNLDLENIWDLVPWSFVVDWFVKVGDGLAALDNYHNITARYKAVAAIQSSKSSLDISESVLGSSTWAGMRWRSSLKATLYRRSCSAVPLMPNPYPSIATVNPLTHWVEGASLVISR